MPAAARVSDMPVCPMQTPGFSPIPHTGSPILPPGNPTVLTGGSPAVCASDSAMYVELPDVIVQGSRTVLIGGRPAARMGDTTAYEGTIVMGCPGVLTGG